MSYNCISHGWFHIYQACPACGHGYTQSADSTDGLSLRDQKQERINELELQLAQAKARIVGEREDGWLIAAKKVENICSEFGDNPKACFEILGEWFANNNLSDFFTKHDAEVTRPWRDFVQQLYDDGYWMRADMRNKGIALLSDSKSSSERK